MNFKTFRFSIVSSMILLMPDDTIGAAKNIPVPDLNPISNRFADLLDSLVKVNVERVDVLKKLFKLYDIDGTKHSLRTQDRKDDSILEDAIVFDNRRDEPFFGDIDNFKEFANLESPYNDVNQDFRNDLSLEDDLVIILPVDSNQLPKDRNDITSSHEGVFSAQMRKGNRTAVKIKSKISKRRGYNYCKSACREACEAACTDYKCREEFYERLRKECKYACKNNFDMD